MMRLFNVKSARVFKVLLVTLFLIGSFQTLGAQQTVLAANSYSATSGRCSISVIRKAITGGQQITPVVRVYNSGTTVFTTTIKLGETLTENTIAQSYLIQHSVSLQRGENMAFKGRSIDGNTGDTLKSFALSNSPKFSCSKTVTY